MSGIGLAAKARRAHVQYWIAFALIFSVYACTIGCAHSELRGHAESRRLTFEDVALATANWIDSFYSDEGGEYRFVLREDFSSGIVVWWNSEDGGDGLTWKSGLPRQLVECIPARSAIDAWEGQLTELVVKRDGGGVWRVASEMGNGSAGDPDATVIVRGVLWAESWTSGVCLGELVVGGSVVCGIAVEIGLDLSGDWSSVSGFEAYVQRQ